MLFHEVRENRLRNCPAVSFVWFLCDSFARGWFQVTSDFPNYYTAARLTADHAPLRDFYEYPAFQREIGRVGIGMQLGGYVPQTPLTMAPLIPLSCLPGSS